MMSNVSANSSTAAQRYASLVLRLIHLLPVIREGAEDGEGGGASAAFEAAWESVKSEVTSLVTAAKAAATSGPRMSELERDVVSLERLLNIVHAEIVAGCATCASTIEQQLASTVANVHRIAHAEPACGPASRPVSCAGTPRISTSSSFSSAPPAAASCVSSRPGSSAGLVSTTSRIFASGSPLPPSGFSPSSAGGKKAPSTPKRTGWGRSVLPQENGLWNASPFHPASSVRSGGSGTLGSPRGGGASTASSRAASAAAAAGGVCVTADRSMSGSSTCSSRFGGGNGMYSLTTSKGGTLHMKLDPETAAQLAALYRPPQKLDSADTLGYKVMRASTASAALSIGGSHLEAHRDGAAPSGAAHHARSPSFGQTGGTGPAPLLNERPAFVAIREAISSRDLLSAGPNAGGKNDDRWLARLVTGVKPATPEEVDAAVGRLEAALTAAGLPIAFERLGPFAYAAGGKRLTVREVNGQLLVRTGGGYEDLITAVGRLPCPPAALPTSGVAAAPAAAESEDAPEAEAPAAAGPDVAAMATAEVAAC